MGVRHFEKSAFRALFVHPEHNGPQHNMIMVQFQDNQGARPGQSGEGNFQWGGHPARLPASLTPPKYVAGWIFAAFGGRRAGTPAPLTAVKMSEKSFPRLPPGPARVGRGATGRGARAP